jgi:hypothetical protein
VPLSGSIEESFRRRVDALPVGTRRLLLVAAAVWLCRRMSDEYDRARAPGLDADLLTDSQSVFVESNQVGDRLANRIVDRRCRHPRTSGSF